MGHTLAPLGSSVAPFCVFLRQDARIGGAVGVILRPSRMAHGNKQQSNAQLNHQKDGSEEPVNTWR